MPEVFREAALRSSLLSFSKYEVAETVRQCARRRHVNLDAEQFVQFPAHGPEVQFIEHPSQHPIAHTREVVSPSNIPPPKQREMRSEMPAARARRGATIPSPIAYCTLPLS